MGTDDAGNSLSHSNLGQNLASGSGLLPICGLFLVLSGGPEFAQQWARIGINTLCGLVMLILVWAIFGIIRDRNCGHRWLHGYMAVAFAGVGLVKAWIAWKWVVGSTASLPLFLSTLENTSLVAFGVCFFATREDLHVTYQRSETQRRANLDKIENLHQAAVFLGYKVESSPAPNMPMEIAANVGRGR
jgi:hypothetical protein